LKCKIGLLINFTIQSPKSDDLYFSIYLLKSHHVCEGFILQNIFLPEFDNDLKSFNLKLGKKLQTSGTPIVYIKIKKLRPKILSRIEGVSVKVGGNNRLKRI